MSNNKENFDVLNERLENLSEDIYSTELEQRNLEQKNFDLDSIFSQSDRFYVELKETWKLGQMEVNLEDMGMELKRHKSTLFNELDDEKERIIKKKRKLEDQQQEIYYERKRAVLNEQEGNSYGG